ncbi:MAG: DNA cytosine methyltransferase, partial [Pseudomonadota bacterium]
MAARAAKPVAEVVDLFCGVGGISHGFKRAGFQIVAGYDIDPGCRYAFENNNDSRFV